MSQIGDCCKTKNNKTGIYIKNLPQITAFFILMFIQTAVRAKPVKGISDFDGEFKRVERISFECPTDNERNIQRITDEYEDQKEAILDDSMQKRIFDSEKLEERLQRSVQTLNQRMEELGRSVRFSVDRVFDKDVISVVNPDSGDLIRQIPPEAALRVSEGVKSLRGMLFDDKA